MMEATRKKRSTFVCEFCNAIVATTFGCKDADVEKHMEETHNILTNLNVVMAIHTMRRRNNSITQWHSQTT